MRAQRRGSYECLAEEGLLCVLSGRTLMRAQRRNSYACSAEELLCVLSGRNPMRAQQCYFVLINDFY